MCGILGEIRFDSQSPNLQKLQSACDILAPRGPDGSGLFQMKNVAFAHRRLKIIDLTEHAQQPMVDNQLGLSIVYNGAIYNYPELRKTLTEYGYQFFSHGDTEVILKAYAKWGKDCVNHLQGMFAFAIWERDTGKTFLARDRLGIKPLYYNEQPNAFRFSSNLPSLLAMGDIDTNIDSVALHHYMHFHAVVPAPYTILKGVRKLPPATYMEISPDGKQRETCYWKLNFETSPEEQKLSFNDWRDQVLDSLRTAVKRRLVADVPVGVLLSGGVDSSLIVGLLAEQGQHGLQTFSVGFETVGDEKGDEFQYSDIIAKHFDTEHHKIFVDSNRLLSELPHCVKAMSEPMMSQDVIGFYLLSQHVSKHVKVVQSGQGADEVFAGYHWYPPMLQSQNPINEYTKLFFDRNHAEYTEAINARFVEDDYSLAFAKHHFEQAGAPHSLDKVLRLDTTIMLVDDPVKRVDNMTMAWGLEARVPFLDHELVELAARVPARYKAEPEGKYVLREAARQVIPHEVIDRPKGYFPVPALKYIQGDYLNFVKEILDAAPQRDLFNQKYLDKLLDAPSEHISPLRGSKLWQIALLEFWLQTHGIK